MTPMSSQSFLILDADKCCHPHVSLSDFTFMHLKSEFYHAALASDVVILFISDFFIVIKNKNGKTFKSPSRMESVSEAVSFVEKENEKIVKE